MTQMLGQTCCIWNHAKNKFNLKVYYSPIILFSTVQMLANPQMFLQNKFFSRNNHLLTPHLPLDQWISVILRLHG